MSPKEKYLVIIIQWKIVLSYYSKLVIDINYTFFNLKAQEKL